MNQVAAAAGEEWRFRPDIEGLRAVAIGLVLMYHAQLPFAQGGFFGVDIFFVLSGFLITGILVDEVRLSGTVSLRRFWARRARRLLPAAMTVAIVVVVFAGQIASPLDVGSHVWTALAFAAYSSNFLFIARANDYFAEQPSADPLLHTWSLSVEEQFYLLYAPAVLLLATWARRSQSRDFVKSLTVALSLVVCASFVASVLLTRRDQSLSFYLLPTRAWELGIGALVCVAGHRITLAPRVASALALCAVAMLVTATLLPNSEAGHPGLITVLPVLATALLVVTGTGKTVVAGLLSLAPIRFVGRLSYSWYLWHWPALVLLRDRVYQPSHKQTLGTVLLSFVPAALTYAAIEMPVRRSKWLAARPGGSLLGAVGLAGCVLIAAGLALTQSRRFVTSPMMHMISEARALQPAIYADGCFAAFAVTRPPTCEYGTPSDTTIVLLGDSHAAHWFPAVAAIAKERRWRLVPLVKLACGWISVPERRGGVKDYPECGVWRRTAIDLAVHLRPAIIVLAARESGWVRVGWRARRITLDTVARDHWLAGIETTLRALQQSGARIVVVRDTPALGADPTECLARHLNEDGACTFLLDPFASALFDLDRRALVADDVRVIDLTDEICPSAPCPPIVNNHLVYRDPSHITVATALALAPAFAAKLDSAISDGKRRR